MVWRSLEPRGRPEAMILLIYNDLDDAPRHSLIDLVDELEAEGFWAYTGGTYLDPNVVQPDWIEILLDPMKVAATAAAGAFAAKVTADLYDAAKRAVTRWMAKPNDARKRRRVIVRPGIGGAVLLDLEDPEANEKPSGQ